VHAANIQDRDGAKLVLKDVKRDHPLLEKVWADGAYRGELIGWVKQLTGIELEIVKRSDDLHTFKIVPKRWVSERTFGWFNRFRIQRLRGAYHQQREYDLQCHDPPDAEEAMSLLTGGFGQALSLSHSHRSNQLSSNG
jgi:transposase